MEHKFKAGDHIKILFGEQTGVSGVVLECSPECSPTGKRFSNHKIGFTFKSDINNVDSWAYYANAELI